MEDDKSNLQVIKKQSFDCKNDIEEYLCGDCENFQTNSLEDIRQHIRDGHQGGTPDEVVYKCLKCHLLTHSKYLFLHHSFYSSCALLNKSERKNRFVSCTVIKPENSSDYQNDLCHDKMIQMAEVCKMRQDPNFECQYFSSQIISEQDLQDYMKNHLTSSRFTYLDIKWLSCQHCPRIYRLNRNFKRHVGVCHTNPKPIQWFQCDLCPSKFKAPRFLKCHKIISHTESENIRWFNCDYCNLKFKLKKYLNCHKLTCHLKPQEIKWFQCEQCPLKFKWKSVLKRHLKTRHSKPEEMQWVPCQQCPSKFKRKCDLKRHIISRHTKPEEIPWIQCEQCPMKFKQKAHLKGHVVSCHSKPKDIKWFQCEQCPSKFKHKTSLNKHSTVCHGNPENIQWFTCEQCPSKKYKEKAQLKRHFKRKHCYFFGVINEEEWVGGPPTSTSRK